MMGARISERHIETHLMHGVQARGGLCLKYFNPSAVGFPDRLCMMPGGVTFWVELKAPGKRPRKAQELRHLQLRGLGQTVHVADSTEAVDAILKGYDERRAGHEI